MTLAQLGFKDDLEAYRREEGLDSFEVGRVTTEHKERYEVSTELTQYECELVGNLRFTAESREDFPAVGDWVAISVYDEGKALIHHIYPRSSIIERQAAGISGQKQIIATNVDFGLIVQAVDRDFNLNRLERYLTICHSSGVQPVVVLSKTDMLSQDDLLVFRKNIEDRVEDIKVIIVSNRISHGYTELETFIQPGKTYCLLGSSGVGKSTLLNHLAGQDLMETSAISDSVNKGRHTTSHRELIVLDKGGILIDNPGMREVGITDASGGLDVTFEGILEQSGNCKYKDCSHQNEDGCAVLEAVENGEISEEAFNNYQKLQREKEHFESTVHERRQKDKSFGKLIKNVMKERKRNKY